MMPVDLLNAISTELIRVATGRLFTDDEIRHVSQHAVGRYFSDLFPEPSDERTARERVEEARSHIAKASEIVGQLQDELRSHCQQLDEVLGEIEHKRKLAEKYEALAQTGEEQLAALRSEMELALRKELEAQSESGKSRRRLASGALWLLTLIAGAALGTYFSPLVDWLRSIAS